MRKWPMSLWAGLLVFLAAAMPSVGQTVRVEVPEEHRGLIGKGETARVVLFMIAPGAKVRGRAEPIDGFFEQDPQPMFGVNVSAESLAAGGGVVVFGPDTEGFVGTPVGKERAWGRLGELPAGDYRVQAALIRDFGFVGNWQETAGNLASGVVRGKLGPGAEVSLKLDQVTEGREFGRARRGVEEFVVRSALLSEFYGKEVVLRAGVRWPGKVEEGRKYGAVYEVPGFGGDHRGVNWGMGEPGPGTEELRDGAFYIVLDPTCPTGHSLFLDSDNNGPWGRALTEELIPALEKKFPLAARKEGRLLRGHSSGGWSVLWLTTEYPQVFGACWSTSPDPVDFRRFELMDIYAQPNLYEEGGRDIPGARIGGKEPTMTVRQENTMEDVLGPALTSPSQWASWQACWGRRLPNGRIRPLHDVRSGLIDREEAETYRRFDIAERLRKDPKRFLPIFREQVRLVVGTADDYYLERAVALLAADLRRLSARDEGGGEVARDAETFEPWMAGEGKWGYVKFVPMTTHGSVYGSAEVRGFAAEMVEYLKQAGLMRGR